MHNKVKEKHLVSVKNVGILIFTDAGRLSTVAIAI